MPRHLALWLGQISLGERERRLLTRLLILSCAVFGLLRLAQIVKTHLVFPMDLGIETPNLIAVNDIRSGRGIYLKAFMEGPPFHILSYTPLFHGLTALFPWRESAPFFVGRLISGIFTLGVMGLFGMAAPRSARVYGMLGAAAFMLVDFVSLNAFVFESASMGLFFSLAAVFCLSRTGKGAAAAAAALCALAFMSKQNYVAAAGAIGLHLLLTGDWKRAAVFSAVYGGLLGSALGYITYKYGDGFWISTFGFLSADFSTATLGEFLARTLKDPLFCLVALVTAALLARSTSVSRADTWQKSPRAVYLAVSLLIAGMGLRAKGGGPNYLCEPLAAALLLLPELAGRVGVFSARAALPLLTAFFLIGGYKIQFMRPLQYSQLSPEARNELLEQKRMISEEMASFGLEDPVVLDLVDSPSAFLVSPHALMSDVYHFSSLWKRGIVSMEPLLAALDEKPFDVITLPRWVSADRPARFPHLEPLRVRIFENYVIEKSGAYFNYLRPRPPRTK